MAAHLVDLLADLRRVAARRSQAPVGTREREQLDEQLRLAQDRIVHWRDDEDGADDPRRSAHSRSAAASPSL